MTSPTIIQQPGALDQATGAFMQSFVMSRGLQQKRQELELERQKVASQTNLEGAQASEARDRAKKLEQEIEDTNNMQIGLRFAQAHLNNLDDDQAFAADTQGLDEVQRGYAMSARDVLRQTRADIAAKQSAAAQSQAEADAMGRNDRENVAIGHTLSQYQGQDFSDPKVMQRMLVDVAKINPEKAHALGQTLTPQDGQFFPVVGPTGDVYVLNRRTGAVTRSDANVGAKVGGAGAGGVTTQEMQFTAKQALAELDAMIGQARTDPTSALIPKKAAAAQGIANVHVPGVGRVFSGIAGPVAQGALSPNQQVFQRHKTSFLHLYGALLPRSRNTQALLENFGQSFSIQSGQDPVKNLPDVMKTWLRMRSLIAPLAGGKQVDMTQLPLFNESVQGASQDATPSQAPTAPLTPGDFLQGVPK